MSPYLKFKLIVAIVFGLAAFFAGLFGLIDDKPRRRRR
jgi:hypothetical protein